MYLEYHKANMTVYGIRNSNAVYNEQMRKAHIKAQDDVVRGGRVPDSASEGQARSKDGEAEDVIEFDEETMKLSPEERDVWFNRNPHVLVNPIQAMGR